MFSRFGPRRRLAIAVAFSAALLLLVSATVRLSISIRNQRTAQRELALGDQYAENGDWHTAIACYTNAIRLQPALLRAYLRRGNAYERIWPLEIDRAIVDYSKAIELDGEDAEAYYHRGVAHYSTIQPKQGVADLTEAIRLMPDMSEAYRYRGAMLLSLGDTTSAIADASEAIRLDPGNDVNWYYRCLLQERMGNYEAALIDATRAVEIEPSTENYVRRAECRMLLKQYAEAIEDYTAAMTKGSESANILRERASALRQIGETARAEADERIAAEIDEREEPRRERFHEFLRRDREAAARNELLRKDR